MSSSEQSSQAEEKMGGDNPELVEEQQPAPSGEPQFIQRSVHIPFPETFVYSNCCAFAIGQTEVRLGFAESLPDGNAIPKIGIVMPPESAAVLALVLLQQVHVFEAHFGEIRHPMWKAMKAGQNPESPYTTRQGPPAPEFQTAPPKVRKPND